MSDMEPEPLSSSHANEVPVEPQAPVVVEYKAIPLSVIVPVPVAVWILTEPPAGATNWNQTSGEPGDAQEGVPKLVALEE